MPPDRTLTRALDAMRRGEAKFTHAVLLELWNGAAVEQSKKKLRSAEALIPVVETTLDVWEKSLELAKRARAAGKTIPAADLLIFATARVHKCELIHNDKHMDWLEKLDG